MAAKEPRPSGPQARPIKTIDDRSVPSLEFQCPFDGLFAFQGPIGRLANLNAFSSLYITPIANPAARQSEQQWLLLYRGLSSSVCQP